MKNDLPTASSYRNENMTRLILFVVFALLFGQTSHADNWPQWRGADLTSKSDETSVPAELDKEKNLLWRIPLPGPAGSSPVVWEDNAFVTTTDGDNLLLMCIGIDEGTVKWKKLLEGVNKRAKDNSGSASGSPSTDGEHVWAMMGNGILVCYTVEGERVWQKDIQKIYGEFIIQFGMSTTPILDGGNLYLALMHGDMKRKGETSVGQIIALDAKSGDEIWVHKRRTDAIRECKHSYASPTIYRDQDHEMLITHGGDYVIGHSLDDGSEIWRCGGFNIHGSSYNPTLRLVSSPSCGEGIIVAPTAKRGPVLGLKVDGQGDLTGKESAKHWELKKGTPDVATPVIYDGLVYLAGEKGDLTCLDARSGEVKYRKRLFADKHRSTPVAVDGRLIIVDRKGTVMVVKSGPELEVLSKLELKEETTASPAISNGKVFLRTFKALYAFGEK